MTDEVKEVAPSRTVVFAVGIESYAYGSAMDLPGAADYAVRFARWAKACGVPDDQIWLGCSWLQQPAVAPIPGVREISTARDSLDIALHELAATDADLLLFYWCGHGLLDEDRKRILFTSNATSTSKTYLPVDDIILLLSSTAGAALRRQILLVDACANYLEDMGFANGLAPFGLERGKARPVDQYVIYSAEQGRIAAYDRLNRTAAFSTALLNWLEAPDPERRSLPPRMTALAEHVVANLQEATAPGEVARLPVTFQVKPYRGEGIWTPGVIPIDGITHATALGHGLPVPQIRRLAEAFATSPLLADPDRASDFAAAIGVGPDALTTGWVERAVTTAVQGGNVETLVATLEGLSQDDLESTTQLRKCWERQRWIAPLLQLPWQSVTLTGLRTAYCRAMPHGTEQVVNDIDTAFDDAADHGGRQNPDAPLYLLVAMLEHHSQITVEDSWFELSPYQLAKLRARARHQLDEAAIQARLIVDLRGTPGRREGPWPDLVSWQLFHAGDWSTREEVAWETELGTPSAMVETREEFVHRGVQAAVDWAAKRVADFRVGLVVPRMLQDKLPETWLIARPIYDPEPLGALYPVVLHSGERFSLRHEQVRETWRSRLERVRERILERTDIDWLSFSNSAGVKDMLIAVDRSRSALIGLEFAPGPATPLLKDDPLVATIASGAPYVVWLEQEPTKWDTAKDAVQQLVDRGPFPELPHRVFEQRREAPNTIGTGLRLLWDDDSLPPVEELRGEQTLLAPSQPPEAKPMEGL